MQLTTGFLAVFLVLFSPFASFADERLNQAIELFDKGQFLQSLEAFKPFEQKGDPTAQAYVGYMLATGSAGFTNMGEARRLLQSAAEQGNTSIVAQLADLYRDGEGGPQDLYLAASWYEVAATANQPYAQFQLARLMLLGFAGEIDQARAKGLLETAAAAGNDEAIRYLEAFERPARWAEAERYFNGANYEEAARAFLPMALRGSMLAGRRYAQSLLPMRWEKDVRRETVFWFSATAWRGDDVSQYELYKVYSTGELVIATRATMEISMFWLREAAEQGLPEAEYVYGLDFLYTLKFARAFPYFLRAAKSGHLMAQVELAKLLADPQGGKYINYDAAFAWLNNAAAAGNPEAQYELSLMYARTDVNQINYTKAFMWAWISSQLSTGRVKRRSDRWIEKMMYQIGPEERQKAVELGRAWMQKTLGDAF
ncbi:tetratricopeptide repeat protein [Thalassospira lucentensis]|uniref:tetratricopeptide repeat protein n=1 Tax=Thalassospira lucentensis TaxID=168935 RepID=UPI0029422442|nr:tetratricopeptide repeat protein [Thalassospira lucentensis]WOI08991.1 tetratricopeptide repeat protein [Thalassospira lucentensis]